MTSLYSPTLLCPGCNRLSTDHQQFRGWCGFWTLKCCNCGSVWSCWWWLERRFKIRLHWNRWVNPGGITPVEMASLIALQSRLRGRTGGTAR